MDNLSQIRKSIIEELKFDYEDFPIFLDQIVTLLGYDIESVPEPISESIISILKEIPSKINCKSGFKIFKHRKVKIDSDWFTIDNHVFNCGKIIHSNINKSETLGFLIATVGNEIGIWSQSLINTNEILKGYLVDKIASELVEKVADKTETKMRGITFAV